MFNQRHLIGGDTSLKKKKVLPWKSILVDCNVKMAGLRNWKSCPSVTVTNRVVGRDMTNAYPFVYYLHHHGDSHSPNVDTGVISKLRF